MTQKHENEKLVPQLLQTIDPREIADDKVRQTIEILLNLVEELNSKVKSLEEEKQKLQDEINRLKGEDGKPDIKANKNKGFKKDHSSEKERKTPKKHIKSSKNVNITKDRLSVIGVLQNKQELQFTISPLTYELLDSLNVPTKWKNKLKLLPQNTAFTKLEFNTLLDTYLSKLGSQHRTRVLETAAISFYHQQTDIPIIQTQGVR